MRDLIGATLFFLGIAAIIATLLLKVGFWLFYAEWIQLDIFSLYAAVTIDGSAAGAESCWPWSITPIESAKCHALAAATFRAWADTALNAKGIAILIEWLGDLSLVWYGFLVTAFSLKVL